MSVINFDIKTGFILTYHTVNHIISLLLANLLFVISLYAQHEHKQAISDTSTGMRHEMNSALTPHAPISRNGSGTSWLPDASPMYAIHRNYGGWMLMFHGGAFIRYTNQNIDRDNQRGGDTFDAPNWFMVMGQRAAGRNGHFMLRGMFSADRLTEGGNGYHLLLQSGESWQGDPLIDRQHPHDLFMELALAYSQELMPKTSLFFYFGLPGEPAIGPTAFMHRPSVFSNPDAPLSHHWQDNAHITFGVATLGIQYKKMKVEGSIFTGREPDENRFNIDEPKFDSYGLRLSFNPTNRLAMQASYGFIHSPEALEPEEDIRRTIASVIYSAPLKRGGALSSTLVMGLDNPNHGVNQYSLLFESEIQITSYTFFTRFELVEKPPEELGIISLTEQKFLIHAWSLGMTRTMVAADYFEARLGVLSTINIVEEALQPFYGTLPLSFEVYLQIIPPLMHHGSGSR